MIYLVDPKNVPLGSLCGRLTILPKCPPNDLCPLKL